MEKNKIAVLGRTLKAHLFPVRLKWRMWLAYFAPIPIAALWPYVFEPTVVNWLIVVAFLILVPRSFSRLMIRGQFKVDARRELRRLHSEYAEILAMLDQLSPEDRTRYDERAKFFALRLLTLNKLLADLEK